MKSYPSEYRGKRKVALALSGGQCIKCGNTAREVHHVYGPTDNKIEHLRPLCWHCHLVAPTREAYWEWEQSGKSGPELLTEYVLARTGAVDTEEMAIAQSVMQILTQFGLSVSQDRATYRRKRLKLERK